MKRIWMMGAAVVLSGVLTACSEKNTAGSTFETENSVATIVVTRVDGTPAAHSVVLIREKDAIIEFQNSMLGYAGDFYEADSVGVVRLKSLSAGDYMVEAQEDLSDDSMLLGAVQLSIPAALPDTSIPVAVEVDEPGVLSGHVETTAYSAYVMVRGTRHVQLVDEQGYFSMQLPKGNFEVVLVSDNQVLASDSVKVELENEPLRMTDSVKLAYFVDDFEDSTLAWYVSFSQYATASLEWAEAGQGREGYAAHFSCENDSLENWALMGHSFGKEMDLSDLDSVSFWIRGDVENYISFSFDVLVDSTSAYASGKAWQHFEITSEWSRYVLTPETLLAVDSIGGNIGWDAVKDHVTNLSIFGGTGGEFWIDDIVFYGVKWE
ncbi:MAG: hypothetical protein K6A31_08515 [Fibrobacter sp.]|nr:hypothetical protein [Fibrobacter sp.]